MAEAVYALCALTSVTAALLLQRGWARSRVRLLLWAAACFWLLTANNLLLFADLVLLDDVDLRELRAATAAAAPLVFLFGLVWDER
jgi:hypothetical protein